MYNVILFAGERKQNGSFDIYITFSGNETEYLMTQRKSDCIYNLLKNGISIAELERHYHKNEKSRHSCELKNSIKHIILVAKDYIRYEYLYFKEREDIA